MRGVYSFVKSTVLGGLLVLVPLMVLIAVVAWAGDLALKVVKPVFAWLPDQSVGGVSLTVFVTVLGLVLLCFVAGLLAETALVRGLSDRAERLALSVPGYALMKSVGTSLVGIEGPNPARTVLVQFQATWQLGFLMDTLADGRHVVFIPGVPRALVGTLHLVAAERVQLLDMPVGTALDVLGRLGVGLRNTWPAAVPAPSDPAPHLTQRSG